MSSYSYINSFRAFIWKNRKINGFSSLLLIILIPYILFIVQELTITVSETTTELYRLNGYSINKCSDIYDESFLFAFVLPRNEKYKHISNTFVDLIMENRIFRNIAPESYIYRTYYNEKQLDEIYRNSSRFIVGVVFNNNLFNYTIKLDKAFLPPTNEDPIPYYKKIDSVYKIGRSSFFRQRDNILNPKRSIYEMFYSPLQKAVDEAILKLVLNNKHLKYDINLAQFAEPQHHYDNTSVLKYNYIIPCVLGLYMFLSKDLVNNIVNEKENNTKKAFVISGIESSFFGFSWQIQYCIKFLFALSLTICVIALIGLNRKIEPLAAFLIIGTSGISIFGFVYLFSVFFNKLKHAQQLYFFLTITLMISSLYLFDLDKDWRISLSLIVSPVSIVSVLREVINVIGIKERLTLSDILHGDLFLFYSFLIFSIIYNFLVSHMLDKILIKIDIDNELNEEYKQIKEFKNEVFPYEKMQNNIAKNIKIDNPIIKVINLHKTIVYPRKNEIIILHSINFEIPSGTIYSIVGKPGSGIVALKNIMIGDIKPSNGEIIYDGKLLSSNSRKIKKEIGICSKYNNLFESLTVEENIIFMSKILNYKIDTNLLLKNMGLIEYKNTIIPRLNHVQKRILSIGLILMAKEKKYIFLDEPTKGLDIISKKKVWDFVNRNRKNKTIIVFTEDITEAEIYTEMKLILVKGQVYCNGSNYDILSDKIQHVYYNIKASSPEIVDNIFENVPKAIQIKNSNKKKILDISIGQTWKIPIYSTNSMNEIFDKAINEGIIKEYTIMIPKLKDFFNRIDDNYETELIELDTKDIKNEKLIFKSIPQPYQLINPTETRYILNLIKKRILNNLKNHKFLFWSILISISLVVFSFDNYEINKENVYQKPELIPLNSEYYYNNRTFIWNYDCNSNITYKNYKILKYVKNKVNKDVLVYDKYIRHRSLFNINQLSLNNELNNTIYVSDVIGYRLSKNHYRYDLIYNATLLHSLPTTINSISNSILYSKGISRRINANVKAFEYNDVEIMQKNSYEIARTFGLVTLFANLYFLYNKLERQKEGIYTLYRSIGINKRVYFITNFTGDLMLSTLLNFIILIMGIRFHNPIFEEKNSLSMFFNIMMLGSIVILLEYHILSKMISNKKSLLIIIIIYHLLFIEIIFRYIFNEYVKHEEFLFIPNSLLLLIIILALFSPVFAVISVTFSLALISNYSLDNIYKKTIGFRGNILAKSELGVSFIFIALSIILIMIVFGINIFYHSTFYRHAKKIIPKRSKKILEQSSDEVKSEYVETTKKYKDLAIGVVELFKEYPYQSVSLDKDYKVNMERILKYQYGQPHNSLYCHSRFSITCIESVTFGVRNYEIFGLLGPPHSGKTFILNAIAGEEHYDAGTIYINGLSRNQSGIEDIVYGYCKQEPTLSNDLTVKEHLETLLDLIGYSNQNIKSFTKELLKFYGIGQYANVKVRYLSMENKKILNLILHTAQGQPVVLMDEPTKFINTIEKRKFLWDRIKQTNRSFKSSILLATNSLEEAIYLCDRVGIISRGRLVYVGTFEQLKAKYSNQYDLILDTKDFNFDEDHFNTLISKRLGINLKLKHQYTGRYEYEVIINSTKELKKLRTALEGYVKKSERHTKALFNYYHICQKTLSDIYTELIGY